MSTENAHVTGELPVVGGGVYVGRHRATNRTHPDHRAAKLVGRDR